MKNFIITCLLLVLLGCSTVPKTGRSQLELVPDGQMVSLGQSSYRQFLSENKLSTDAEKTAMVKRVSQKIASAVEQYLKQENRLKNIEGFNWEFNLVESKEVNAGVCRAEK